MAADRIRAFRDRLRECVAERVVPTEHGVGLFCDSTPGVYDANFLLAERAAAADVLAAEADAAMERFFHRRVIADTGGEALAPGFAGLGWSRSTHLVLAHRRRPDRRVDTGAVREVPLEAIRAAHWRVTLAEPYGSEGLAAALFAVKQRVGSCVRVRYFAAYAGDEVAAYCELRSDGGVAQIEDVNTLAEHRGRGLGRAVVQRALDEGAASSGLVYLEALANDWPKELYRKLGFDEVGVRHLFLRPPRPLSGLVVQTPRLELRLATIAELRELAQVALAGVHDPAAMPFEVPWTDELEEDGFVAYHEERLDEWSPKAWRLNLVAFHEGRPIGSQGMHADDFHATRRVRTGSWLGRRWQGRGLGTEMRAAVLELAFAGLGARVAESGAWVENDQSLGVSRRLGYVETGRHLISPRGEPLEHVDLELRREGFRSPVPVEIEGLPPLLRLFGAA